MPMASREIGFEDRRMARRFRREFDGVGHGEDSGKHL